MCLEFLRGQIIRSYVHIIYQYYLLLPADYDADHARAERLRKADEQRAKVISVLVFGFFR